MIKKSKFQGHSESYSLDYSFLITFSELKKILSEDGILDEDAVDTFISNQHSHFKSDLIFAIMTYNGYESNGTDDDNNVIWLKKEKDE